VSGPKPLGTLHDYQERETPTAGSSTFHRDELTLHPDRDSPQLGNSQDAHGNVRNPRRQALFPEPRRDDGLPVERERR
jgi:hypothetical protein